LGGGRAGLPRIENDTDLRLARIAGNRGVPRSNDGGRHILAPFAMVRCAGPLKNKVLLVSQQTVRKRSIRAFRNLAKGWATAAAPFRLVDVWTSVYGDASGGGAANQLAHSWAAGPGRKVLIA
jgi:hypothetical protein